MSCREAVERAALSEDDFWDRVFPQVGDMDPPDLDDVEHGGEPCSECGSVTACSYDAEGRALIHVQDHDDE